MPLRPSAIAAETLFGLGAHKQIAPGLGGRPGASLSEALGGDPHPAGETGPELRGLGVLSASGLPSGDHRGMTKMRFMHVSAAENAYGTQEPNRRGKCELGGAPFLRAASRDGPAVAGLVVLIGLSAAALADVGPASCANAQVLPARSNATRDLS